MVTERGLLSQTEWNHRGKVLPILAAWGYAREDIGPIQPVLDVYRVETPDGPMNLKWTRHSDAMLVFVTSALRYVTEHGFRHLCPPRPTVDGRPFHVAGGEHYLLSAWIEGTQVDLSRPEQLEASLRTLAGFHQASRGYKPPPGANQRARWGQLLESLAKRCLDLERYPIVAAARSAQTGFDRAIKAETEYYLGLAVLARELLERSAYRELAVRAASEGGLCHGDTAARNFIRAPGGEVYLIDFDGLRQDLALTDLWKLFRRAMKRFNWSFEAGQAMLQAYESVQPLSAAELEVLLALLSFPQKFWRLASRYYSGEYSWDEERFLRKLRKYTQQRQAHAAFISSFAAFCRARGVDIAWPGPPFPGQEAGGGHA